MDVEILLSFPPPQLINKPCHYSPMSSQCSSGSMQVNQSQIFDEIKKLTDELRQLELHPLAPHSTLLDKLCNLLSIISDKFSNLQSKEDGSYLNYHVPIRVRNRHCMPARQTPQICKVI